jgi:hypothetical protein
MAAVSIHRKNGDRPRKRIRTVTYSHTTTPTLDVVSLGDLCAMTSCTHLSQLVLHDGVGSPRPRNHQEILRQTPHAEWFRQNTTSGLHLTQTAHTRHTYLDKARLQAASQGATCSGMEIASAAVRQRPYISEKRSTSWASAHSARAATAQARVAYSERFT